MQLVKHIWNRSESISLLTINGYEREDSLTFRTEGISGQIIEETVQWKDKRTTEVLEKRGWTPPNRFSDGKEVIHFDMEVFSGKGTYEDSNDYTLIWVWRWDGFSWIWDENKYTPEEALSKYPMKDFTWVSVNWEEE